LTDRHPAANLHPRSSSTASGGSHPLGCPIRPSANGRVDARALELVGYRLIGVLVLASNLPEAVDAVAVLATTGTFGNIWGYQIGSVAAVAIGLYLLFGASGLASLVDRARGAGLQPGEQAWKSPRL
jgi:hypothetical protein